MERHLTVSMNGLDMPQTPQGAPRIMVVDKDPHVQALLQTILGEAGYAPIFIADGYAALDSARISPPAVLMTEIMIPRLDGLTLCRLLKSDEVTRDTKVLVFSILGSADRARSSGADAFLLKPVERHSLVAALRRLAPPLTDAEGNA